MRRSILMGGLLAIAAGPALMAQEGPAPRPTFKEDGTVLVPAFELPPSELSSPEARAMQGMRAKMGSAASIMDPDIVKARAGLEQMMAPQVAAAMKAHAVDVVDQKIGGVPVKTFTPKGRPFDRQRVLINVHGGAFQTCWPACAYLESTPIAALGGYKVVSVNYRMSPEARHPAGVEDVEKVYRELLKSYDPKRIGLYGCSAGGALTGQAAAWMPRKGLPQFAAIGIFGSGAMRFGAGDSAYVAGYIDGSFPPPPGPGQPRGDLSRGYFTGSEMTNPTVSPALHLDVAAKFPPTLIITGTRAMDMSPAIYTNSQLLKAGVESRLIVGEGMGHCYIYQSHLPEARDAQQEIVDFFRDHLK